MSAATWEQTFRSVFNRGAAAWDAGHKSARTMFSKEDVQFLSTIGCTAQELFDFVDDLKRYGEPDFETVLKVQAIRRDYFLSTMNGKFTGKTFAMEQLPPKSAAVEGIVWLPRIIQKARVKLRGEMPDELMYGCGGDREFFHRVRMPADAFLTLVRDSGDNDRRIIDAVKKSAGRV